MTKELYEEKFCYLGVCDLPQLPFGLKGYEIQWGLYIVIHPYIFLKLKCY